MARCCLFYNIHVNVKKCGIYLRSQDIITILENSGMKKKERCTRYMDLNNRVIQ